MSANTMLHFMSMEAEKSLNSQLSTLKRQTTLSGVVRYSRPNVPSHLIAISQASPASRRLKSVSEEIAKAVIDKQLFEAKKLPLEEGVKALDRLANSEWRILNGNLPRAAHYANKARLELKGLLYKESLKE